jgi:hypothetical protein
MATEQRDDDRRQELPQPTDSRQLEIHLPGRPDDRQFSLGFAIMCECGKPAHIPHCCGCGG